MIARPDLAEVRPVVFVSSTVRDLGDLRSSVKYFLEEHGFVVHTSETADFPHPVDREAWRAGLFTVDSADYFVMIIGSRYGTVADGLSITHHEFRRAKERQQASGRPGIVVLVREDVLRFKREGMTPLVADDWESICALIDEAGTAENPNDPNWISGFGSFREVADVLRASMSLHGSLRRRAIEANVIAELEENARHLFVRVGGLETLAWDLLMPREIERVGPDELFELTAAEAAGMKLLYVVADRTGSLRLDAVRDAIASGEFLAFDPPTGTLRSTPLLELLVKVRNEVEALKPMRELLRNPSAARQFAAFAATTGAAAVEFELAFLVYVYRDRLQNVGILLQRLYGAIATGAPVVVDPLPRPPTPIRAEAERIADEEVDAETALTWLQA